MATSPRIIEVDDPRDPRLVEMTELTDAEARASIEAEHGCFVVEGLLCLEAAVSSPHPLRSVLVSEAKLGRVLAVLDDVDVEVFVGRTELLEAVTGFPIHRGVVASAARVPVPAAADLLHGARGVVVVEGLNDHENLGALFRNAAAFGIDAVLVDRATADPLYRRSVRVSVGHVLRVPWARVDRVGDALTLARRAGLTTVALTPTGAEAVADVAATTDGVAWVVGAEGPGLSDEALAASDRRARIPMAGGVDSVNVATAAAIAFSHAFAFRASPPERAPTP